MSNKGRENVQWSYDFIQNFYLNNSENLGEAERVYLDYLSPFAEKYFGPTNPLLLIGGADIGQMMKKNLWTIRDGLIPLSFFFAENGLNEKKLNLMVHKDLWFIVPEKWRQSVTYFEIRSENVFSSGRLPKRIIIMGTPNETLADPEEFEEDVLHLSHVLGRQHIEKMEVVGYFPNKRTDLWGRWQDENIFKYSRALFKHLKMEIEFPEWQNLKNMMSLNDTLFYEINRGHFIKDSFPLHLFLSRGAGLLETEPTVGPFQESGKVKLSLYHHMTIYKLDESNCEKYIDPLSDDLLPYLKKMIAKGTSPRNINNTWEKWFATYIKKYYQRKEMI